MTLQAGDGVQILPFYEHIFVQRSIRCYDTGNWSRTSSSPFISHALPHSVSQTFGGANGGVEQSCRGSHMCAMQLARPRKEPSSLTAIPNLNVCTKANAPRQLGQRNEAKSRFGFLLRSRACAKLFHIIRLSHQRPVAITLAELFWSQDLIITRI